MEEPEAEGEWVELDIVPLLIEWELAEALGAPLRCGCKWYQGRHAVVSGSCWIHSPDHWWGVLAIRVGGKARRWLRP